MNLIRKIPSKLIRTSQVGTTSIPKNRWIVRNPFTKKGENQSHDERDSLAGLYTPLEEYTRYRKEVLNLSANAELEALALKKNHRKRARSPSHDDHSYAKRLSSGSNHTSREDDNIFVRKKRARESNSDDHNAAKKPRLNDTPIQYAIKHPSQYADPNRKVLESLFDPEITAEGWKKKSDGFEYHTQIRGTTYYNMGNSIDDAREHVAEKVLKELCDFRREYIRWPDHLLPFRLNQEFADQIERMVKTKFDDIMVRDLRYKEHKVLAGIVMTTHALSPPSAKVVAIGTGTKCFENVNRDGGGTILHDMHAEVVARRSFKRFLCHQLNEMRKKKSSVFEWQGKDIRLKDGVKFHLYCNAIPCGDARVFSLRGLMQVKNEAKMGSLRIKKIGGTEPISENIFRITSLSCSDKIARWNVLGLQGSQLAKFIKPIYLESIVLGSRYSPVHLYRAIGGRLTDILPVLPSDYRLNKPYFESTSLIETENSPARESMKYGICWSDVSDDENGPEVLDLLTGLTNRGHTSKISKLSFMRMFNSINQKLPYRSNDGIANFQKVKEQFYLALKKGNYGAWEKIAV
ncbi:double-stranded RNA-specific editase Adar-like isoform X2 [Bradysia coprophila]|uniref:double-stranded RNA-specific editase Adar-like isoform X2 n=1 Tax=Bradysia coprophila TaxID=38358 RepID=UPI00187D9BC9|nr:double-stranded RNA-specific editase Adar-like isoform X2 [Bradysia coprophila]